MAAERWLPHPRYPDRYEVSARGRVRSVRVLAQQQNPDGYLQVTLRDADGRTHIEPVHRLVMETHAGPCPDGMEILHRNGRRDDPRRRNLRYGTKPENRADREEHKRTRAGRGKGEQKREQRETGELDGTRFLSLGKAETVSPEVPS
jgi:hypothetical protein